MGSNSGRKQTCVPVLGSRPWPKWVYRHAENGRMILNVHRKVWRVYRCRQGHGQASHRSLRLPFLFRLLGSPLPSHVDLHTVYVITWPYASRRVRAPTPAASSTAGVLFKIWYFLITGLIFYDKYCNFRLCVSIWAHSKNRLNAALIADCRENSDHHHSLFKILLSFFHYIITWVLGIEYMTHASMVHHC